MGERRSTNWVLWRVSSVECRRCENLCLVVVFETNFSGGRRRGNFGTLKCRWGRRKRFVHRMTSWVCLVWLTGLSRWLVFLSDSQATKLRRKDQPTRTRYSREGPTLNVIRRAWLNRTFAGGCFSLQCPMCVCKCMVFEPTHPQSLRTPTRHFRLNVAGWEPCLCLVPRRCRHLWAPCKRAKTRKWRKRSLWKRSWKSLSWIKIIQDRYGWAHKWDMWDRNLDENSSVSWWYLDQICLRKLWAILSKQCPWEYF